MKTRKQSARIGSLSKAASRDIGTLKVSSLVEEYPFSVLRVRMKPGASHPPLWHAKTCEFFLVLDGSMRAEIGSVSRRFKKGDFAALPPGCAHEFHAGESGVEVLAVFSPALDLKKPDIVLA